MMELLKLFLNPIKLCQEHFTFWGGGGGGGNTTSTVTQTNLPAWAKPYYQELLKQTGKEIFTTDAQGNVTGIKDYNLPDQQVVGLQPEQLAAMDKIGQLQSPEEFELAKQGMINAQTMGQNYATQGMNKALAYDPTTRTFNQQYYDQYANPFQQNVINTALREAQLTGDLSRRKAMLGSIGRGTFGGARQTLADVEGLRNLMQTKSDIQYRGMADAFQKAQEQFNTEEQRRIQAAQYAAGLGKDIGLGGLNLQSEMSKSLGALATARQDADLARLRAQEAVGTAKQAQKQKEADTAYQNAMARANFAKSQLQFYNDILRGNANALGATQVQYAPAPSMASQIGGLGIAGLSLANVMGKSS